VAATLVIINEAFKALLPVLLSFTVCAALVIPTFVFVKVIVEGTRLTTGATCPVPESEIV
jgi:hypothetical protein